MVNGQPQQNGTATKVVVLRAVCDPSLKESFLACLSACGFRQQTDAILTLARDLVAGRIQYKGGVLQSQEKNQPDSAEGQGSPPAAPLSSKTTPATGR